MTTKIKVLIADDTDVTREGLRRFLADARDMSVMEARTIYETIRLARQLHPDVVLMDLKWSGDENAGASAIELIRREVPAPKIIAITVYEPLIKNARDAGADLAITKDFTRDQLLAHIREIHSYGSNPSAVVPESNIAEEPLMEPPTDREMEVLRLLAEGLADRVIAERLVISENTVKNHVGNILSKLNAANRTAAVVIAVRKGLLDISGPADSNSARRW